MNWIELRGNYCKIEGNSIKFRPPKAEMAEGNTEDASNNQDDDDDKTFHRVVATPSSTLRSSIKFENGIVEFVFKAVEPSAIITLKIGEIFIGTNGRVSSHLYSIRKKAESTRDTFKVVPGTGTKNTLQSNKEYRFRVEVIGSNVIFSIDDVMVVRGNYTIENEPIQFTLTSKSDITISNLLVKTKKLKAFIVMQFTAEYNELYNDVIKPVCEKFGYEPIRADEFYQSSLILSDIIESIKESTIIIADITEDNPNVFYEVGFAHALNKATILLSDKKRTKLPFDVSGFRTLFYDNTIGGKSKVEDSLRRHLEHLND